MLKKLNLIIVLIVLITLLLESTAMAAVEADPISVAPIGLVIFGIASLAIGLVGYAVAHRKSG